MEDKKLKRIYITMRKIIFTSLFALLAAQPSLKAQILADWDFDAATESAPYNTPAATSGTASSTATATQLGMTNAYTYTNGEGPGSLAACDVTAAAGASTGANSNGWRIRGNSNTKNAGAGMANGWNTAAPIGTQGAEFSVNTAGYTALTLTFDLNVTTQAERNLVVLYTLNDKATSPTWLNATLTSGGVSSGGTAGTIVTNTTSTNTVSGNYLQLGTGGSSGWNNQISATFEAAAAQDPNFAFEIVNASTGTDDVNVGDAALNNNSGNWRFDNVELSGTVATPEPSSWALAGLGLLALLAFRARRNRRA
jgi:MYXO-CTERM domain-containing protein